MKDFLGPDFLLTTDASRELYYTYAKDLPIFDYRSHIRARDIAEDKQFANLNELWLKNDAHKWRLMRLCGVPEKYITGDAEPFDKFISYVRCVQKAYGNSLYHWSHMELSRYFGINCPITEDNARMIWEEANRQLVKPEFSVRQLLCKSNVQGLCTLNDPNAALEDHQHVADLPNFTTKVLPTFCPAYIFRIEYFKAWVADLVKQTNHSIQSLEDLLAALTTRIEYFAQHGCVCMDILTEPRAVFDDMWPLADSAFKKALVGDFISYNECDGFKAVIMDFLTGICMAHGWVMQFHLGTMYDNNEQMYRFLGPNIGCECFGRTCFTTDLQGYFDRLDAKNSLPKTLVHSANPNDNALIHSIVGCFSREIPGKVQQGGAWWFNHHEKGIKDQLIDFAAGGVLANFVGTPSDAYTPVSLYVRHEYFRRILCDLLGSWMEEGKIVPNNALVGQTIQDICLNNSIRFFCSNKTKSNKEK